MTTTIQIASETRQLLERIKEKEAAASYDEVIQHLVKAHSGVPRSMFGIAPKKFKFTRADKLRLHEL